MQQHFKPEFVEKYKQCYLFNGVVEELTKGANPYMIIQELIEHLAGVTKEHQPVQVDLQKYYDLEKKWGMGAE